ncbi:MAG: hypothetical protein AAF372_00920, partial [Pseudomonadota bacterium]
TRNLMIFLHPVILRNRASANLVTDSKYNFIRQRHLDTNFEDRGLIEQSRKAFPTVDELVTQLPDSVKEVSPPTSNDAFIPQSPTSNR